MTARAGRREFAKTAPRPAWATNRNRAIVQRQNPGHGKQAQAAGLGPRSARHTDGRVNRFSRRARGYLAVVAHGDHGGAISRRSLRTSTLLPGRAMANGVVEQIGQDTLDHPEVGLHER